MNFLQYILNSIPLIIALIVWAVHLEKKITMMETNISWLMKELPACRPNSEKITR